MGSVLGCYTNRLLKQVFDLVHILQLTATEKGI